MPKVNPHADPTRRDLGPAALGRTVKKLFSYYPVLAPVTTATALVSALSPDVQLTCFWHADAGTVSTTLATVPPDAGAIAAAALPGSGFTCESVDERTRCTRTDGDLTETIEAGGGLWLSTSESAWHPAGYVSRTGDRIWG